MVAAVWNGSSDRRRILHSCGAVDGFVFHGAGCSGAVLPVELGKYFSGRGLRGPSHCFWRGNREEIWWLNQERIARSAKNRESGERLDPGRRRHRLRILTG